MSQTSPCPNCGVVHPFGNENCPKVEMRTFPAPAPEVETRPAETPSRRDRLAALRQQWHRDSGIPASGVEDDPYEMAATHWALMQMLHEDAASSAPAEPHSKLREKALRLAVRVLHDERLQDDDDLHMLAADVEVLANDRLATRPADDQRRFGGGMDANARRLSDTVFNYLGTRDPGEVARWIAAARQEVAAARASSAPAEPTRERYEIQSGSNIDGYRVTDKQGDNRIATCYDVDNALLVVKALNAASPSPGRSAE